jgi:hypothetical protein
MDKTILRKVEDNYENFIVSSRDFVTCLHRTSIRMLDDILENGPYCMSLSDGSITRQPENPSVALARYTSGNVFGMHSIILQFPREQFNTLDAMDNFIYKDKGNIPRIKPEFAVGYIDTRTNEVYLKFPVKEERK